MINEVIELLEKYCDGKGNIDKVEISVLQLHRIIKALKQQPCEDAVSRQAVLGLFAQNGDAVRPYSKTWEEVKTLPPVDPQQRVGHWISLGIQGEVDGQIVQVFTCSECGAISIFRMTNGNIVNGNICPNCGVKMVEPQKSEVRNDKRESLNISTNDSGCM